MIFNKDKRANNSKRTKLVGGLSGYQQQCGTNSSDEEVVTEKSLAGGILPNRGKLVEMNPISLTAAE